MFDVELFYNNKKLLCLGRFADPLKLHLQLLDCLPFQLIGTLQIEFNHVDKGEFFKLL